MMTPIVDSVTEFQTHMYCELSSISSFYCDLQSLFNLSLIFNLNSWKTLIILPEFPCQ